MNSEPRFTKYDGAIVQATLRVLATSDLHMNLLGFDYIANKPRSCCAGLAQLASLITEARAEDGIDTSILLDNGDALQGAAIAETAAANTWTEPHPLAQAFNALSYDAIGLGNHDFDFGLGYLAHVMSRYSAPTLSSNLTCAALPDLCQSTLIKRTVHCSDGTERSLHVGVLSVLPEQTMVWNSQHLLGRAQIGNMHAAVREAVPKLKDAGADIIVLLAHSGIGSVDGADNAENAAFQLAQHAGIDAVIAGHTHGIFPDITANHDSPSSSPPYESTFNGTPAAMPGFGGSHLAVLDLVLEHNGEAWQMSTHTSDLRAPTPETPVDPQILAASDYAHTCTTARLSEVVGHSKVPINSYFSLIQSSPSMALCAQAKRVLITQQIQGSALEGLPILASASAYASGGKAGPDNYVDFQAGAIIRRDLHRLAPFENALWGSILTGAEVRAWLERSAAIFKTLRPDTPEQCLIDPACPGFNFDVLHGLDFTINPTRPSRYSAHGVFTKPTAGRIENLCYQGTPVTADQKFLVASTSYRLAGGGNFPGRSINRVDLRTDIPASLAFERLLNTPEAQHLALEGNWRFSPGLDVQAMFKTNPAALDNLSDIAHYTPEVLGLNENGFQCLRLSL